MPVIAGDVRLLWVNGMLWFGVPWIQAHCDHSGHPHDRIDNMRER